MRKGNSVNEFTKEELEDIVHLINDAHKGTQKHGLEWGFKLRDKIQSMIDNYCEHEWENICCQCTLDKIYCYKCEKDMGDLKERYNG